MPDDLIVLGVLRGVLVFRLDLGPGGFAGIATVLFIMAATESLGIRWTVLAGIRCQHDGPCRH